jgi:hypothetical protein
LIKNLKVGQVEFNDFRSTMNSDNIVVTYMISVQETIDLEQLPTKPTPRLSVWRKGATGVAMDLPRQPQPDPLEIIWSVRSAYPGVMGPKLTSENGDRCGAGPIPNDISDH